MTTQEKPYELYPAGRILLPDPMLTEDQQRDLISYLWKKKPGMVREIVCNGCEK